MIAGDLSSLRVSINRRGSHYLSTTTVDSKLVRGSEPVVLMNKCLFHNGISSANPSLLVVSVEHISNVTNIVLER